MAGKIPETQPGFPGSSFKYTPMRHVRVMFIRFCQGLFSAAPIGAYHWDEDENQSEIIITNENKLDPEVIARRPGLHFTRGPIQMYSLGIDDLISYEWDIDKKTKGVLIPGTMTINAVSRVQQESEDIAWVVMEHIWLLRDLLMRAGFFEIGRQPQMGSPSPAGSIVANDQGDEFVATSVSVPFQFSRTSSFTPLGKQIVRSIQFQLGTNTPQYVGSLGPPAQGHNGPNNITHSFPAPFAPQASDVGGLSPDPAGSRQVFLPKQPHPLNPAQTVRVRTVRPHARSPIYTETASAVPITDTSVEESGT